MRARVRFQRSARRTTPDTERHPTPGAPGRESSLADAVRPVAVGVVVLVAALAFATLLRPRAGYASAQPLLFALALGAGLGVVSLVLIGAVARLARPGLRGRRSLRRSATAWPSMAIVVTIFVTSAAAPRVVHGISVLSRGGGVSRSSQQAAFRTWQQLVVPIVVSYASAVGKDAVLVHGLPRGHLRRLLRAVSASEAVLTRLGVRLRSDAAQLPARPELARLTTLLERSLASGQAAQRTLVVALGKALGVRSGAGRRAWLERLLAGGLAQLRRSQAAMFSFSLEANKLGASLFVQAP